MGMTDKNLCDSCTNIGCVFQSGIVRTECDFYIRDMQKELEDKDIELHIDRETLLQEYIPKAQYEQRLKADMMAMLTELLSEIEGSPCKHSDRLGDYSDGVQKGIDIIQQKINALKAETEDI